MKPDRLPRPLKRGSCFRSAPNTVDPRRTESSVRVEAELRPELALQPEKRGRAVLQAGEQGPAVLQPEER
jgi:hypothetical protein